MEPHSALGIEQAQQIAGAAVSSGMRQFEQETRDSGRTNCLEWLTMRSETDFPHAHRPAAASRGLRLRQRLGAGGLVLAVLAVAAFPAVVSAASLAEKRAQASRIAAQVSKLDNQYDHLQERYRGAEIRLDDLTNHVKRLSSDLRRTQGDLNVAEQRLVNRAVVIYQGGAGNTQLVNLAQSGSLSNFIDRMDTIQRVGKQDSDILTEIKQLRLRVATKRSQLRDARTEQVTLVAQAKRDKTTMGKKLRARKAVLGSVNGEILAMVAAQQAAERARAAAAARESAGTVKVDDNGGSGVAAPSSGGDSGAAFSAPSVAAPPASGAASTAAGIAMRYIGVPYLWAGASPSGFDCSGLVMYSFAQVGISLPHSTYALWNLGTHVSRDQLQSGDMVFFSGLGHMGIYVGGGSYVHAPHSGAFVRVNSMFDSYGTNNYVGAVRL